jgi:hypothetical protein
MTSRVDGFKYMTSDSGQAMLSLGKAVDASGLERSLLDLVKVRASDQRLRVLPRHAYEGRACVR